MQERAERGSGATDPTFFLEMTAFPCKTTDERTVTDHRNRINVEKQYFLGGICSCVGTAHRPYRAAMRNILCNGKLSQGRAAFR
jgi:hypothetical protein